MEVYEFILEKLKAGEIFGSVDKHILGGTYFWDVMAISEDQQYIVWRHYGSSANKATTEDLKWVIETIFQMTGIEFLYTYITYSEWKKIHECYEVKHPEEIVTRTT